jgi:hypothetical protein
MKLRIFCRCSFLVGLRTYQHPCNRACCEVYVSLAGKLGERVSRRDLDVKERIILKYNKEEAYRILNEFVWLKYGRAVNYLGHGTEQSFQ